MKQPPPPPYLSPTSPEAVLYNLKLAYTNRDSVEYKSLYNDTYQGSFIDQRDPSPVLALYSKTDEAQHIAYLAQNSLIPDLLLSPDLVRLIDQGDPPGWITIHDPFQKLEVGSWRIVPGTEDLIDMKFVPIPPTKAGADTTWQIIRLVETRS